MYMGHIGIALGARAARPSVPLWALVCAAMLPDLANTAWNLVGIGDPGDLRSHSIPAVLGLAASACILYALVRRDWPGGALLGGLAVSHVLADYVTSRELLWRGGPMVGAHLYLHHRWDFALEGAVIPVGWLLYRKSLRTQERVPWPLYSMLLVLLGFQFMFMLLPIT